MSGDGTCDAVAISPCAIANSLVSPFVFTSKASVPCLLFKLSCKTTMGNVVVLSFMSFVSFVSFMSFVSFVCSFTKKMSFECRFVVFVVSKTED